jgi:hypothetical protein
MKKVVFSILVLLLLFSCKSYYIAPQFEYNTISHKTIAILPVEVDHIGNIPDELTTEDIENITQAESKAFQISFYNELLRSTRSGRNNIRVQVQDYRKTINLLDKNNIDIHDSWHMPNRELASILKVDAIVKTRIQKTRYMSDLASYGVEVAVHIVNVLANYHSWLWLPPHLTRSKEILAEYRLISDNDHLLWSINYDVDADWRSPAKEIIDSVTRRAAKKFPYRI